MWAGRVVLGLRQRMELPQRLSAQGRDCILPCSPGWQELEEPEWAWGSETWGNGKLGDGAGLLMCRKLAERED